MKRFIYFILTLILLGTASIPTYPKPAKRDVRTVQQPDGTFIDIKVVGDESMHFTTTPDGVLLHKDSDGFYRIGRMSDDGAVESTGIDFNNFNVEKGLKLTEDIITDIKEKRIRKQKIKSRSSLPQAGIGRFSEAYPTLGNPKCLIILVEFSDVKFKTVYNPKSYFTNMINGENFTEYNGTGSALKYFSDQSGGKFEPSFDIYGPVTLPNSQAYYGRNDRYGDEPYAHLMISDAIVILDPEIDYSQYDTDGDGYIDNIYVFYAGQGEADYGSENTVWPHSWNLTEAGLDLTVDNVIADRYACSNEWSDKTPDGVGTFVHEFSHVMGLPDLYHTFIPGADYTPGTYSVLDYGCYNNNSRTPANYSAYEKNAMGWYEPIMMNNAMTVSLDNIDSGEFGLIPTEKPNEFFLFENRQQQGWDKFIPGHGMLIWHIDYNEKVFTGNTVNNTKNHQYVDIVEANNKTGSRYEEGYTFPGISGATSFTSETSPAFKSWANKNIDFPITDIKEKNGVITFDVDGGTNSMASPSPTVTDYSEAFGYFTISWDPIENATDYIISVYSGNVDNSGCFYTGFDNSQLAEGWQASSLGWYSSNSNFGETSPSYKFSSNDQTLTSPETEGDINKIEFWVKGQNTENTYLKIEGLKIGEWVEISKYAPLKNKAESVIIDSDLPADLSKIRFTMTKTTGNIAIDDISIFYGDVNEVLENYDNVSTGGETSFKVDKLLPGIKEYSFIVSATDGEKTKASRLISFTLSGEAPSIIEKISVSDDDDETEYFNLQGMKISKPKAGSLVISKKGKKIKKIINR